MDEDLFIGIAMCLFVLGALTLIGMTLRGRQRLRELAIRERIAMIERGFMSAPEADPDRFDRGLQMVSAPQPAHPKGIRYRTMGIMLMGLGGALFLLLAFAAGVPQIAFGVAGGVFVLGVAAYANGALVSGDLQPPLMAPLQRPAAPVQHPAPERPDNVAP